MELGFGSYASVSIVEIDGKKYAEKLSKKSTTRAAADFVREWAVLGVLAHPNVMSVIDILITDGKDKSPGRYSFLLPLALCDGITMCKTMEYNPVEISFGIACGLEYLQTQGVYHCDVKLKNILIFAEASGLLPVVADFGHSEIEFSEVIRPNRTNTKSYRSPELHVALSGTSTAHQQTIGYSSSVWSFGVVLYYLFNKRMPFRTDKAENLERDLTGIIEAVGFSSDERKRFTRNHTWLLNSLQTAECRINIADEKANHLLSRCLRMVPDDRITFREIVQHNLFAGLEGYNPTPCPKDQVYLRDYVCVGSTLTEHCDEELYEPLRVFSAACVLFCSVAPDMKDITQETLVFACFSIACKVFTYMAPGRNKFSTSAVAVVENRILREHSLSCLTPSATALIERQKTLDSRRLLIGKRVYRLLQQGTEGTLAALVDQASKT